MDAMRLAVFLQGNRVHATGATRVVSGCAAFSWGDKPYAATLTMRYERLDQREDVWCPTTDLGSWVVELDGHMMLTGNCWARYGFAYASPKVAMDRARMLDRTRLEMRQGAPPSRGITQQSGLQAWDIPKYPGVDDDIKRVVAMGAKMTPQAVAEIGILHATENEWGDKMWTGKAIMLHQSQDGWEGVKPVQPREERSY